MVTYTGSQVAAQANANVNKSVFGYILYNVKAFGAVGDGVTDDTAAVQKTIDYANSIGGQTIYFPHTDVGYGATKVTRYKVTALSGTTNLDFIGDNAEFTGGFVGSITNMGDVATIQEDLTQFEEDYAKQVGKVYNVIGYGADPTGIVNSKSQIQSAINAANTAGGGTVYFPEGTYLFNSTITGYSNVHLLGAGKEVTILKAGASMTSMISFLDNKRFFSIKSMTIDFDNVNMGAEGISIRLSDNFEITNCYFKNIPNYGLSLNAVNNFRISNNIFERQTAIGSTYNVALVVGETSGQSYEGIIEKNLFNKSSINLSGREINVLYNEIKDYMCGAGIVTEQAANSQKINVIGNVIHGSRGTDINGYTCGGLEIWSTYSIAAQNVIYDNAGAGIDWGSLKGECTGNVIYNNGVTVNSPGISIRYGTASYNGSESVISGNKIFDTLGASGTQTYGILDQSSSTNYVVITGNNLKGNKTGMMSILGTKYTIHQGNLSASIVWDPASIANGASAENDIVQSGARVGDFVHVSCSIDTQGMILTGRINAINNVKIRLQNNTGAAIDLGSATYRVLIIKPIDAADY